MVLTTAHLWCDTCTEQELDYEAKKTHDNIIALRVAARSAIKEAQLQREMIQHLQFCNWEGVIKLMEEGITAELETPEVQCEGQPGAGTRKRDCCFVVDAATIDDQGHNALTLASEREAYVSIEFLFSLYGESFQVHTTHGCCGRLEGIVDLPCVHWK